MDTSSGKLKETIVDQVDAMETTLAHLFPEMTANVDPENEDRLQKAIEALTRNKTIIMIAHRLKTVRRAVQIIVIDHGRIVQKGRHEELVSVPGIYADFIGGKKPLIGNFKKLKKRIQVR